LEAQGSKDRATEESLVYCASRLFAIQDRVTILSIANAIENALPVNDNIKVFLPFRNTDQAALDGPNKARLIYEHDISALKRARLVVALVDGISKDDGVAMELGYAFGLGIPFILCTTDFIKSQATVTGQPYICDPLVDDLAAGIIAEDGFHLFEKLSYEEAHTAGLELFAETVATSVIRALRSERQGFSSSTRAIPANGTFVDIAGGKYAYSEQLQIILSAGAKNCFFGSRWNDGCSHDATIRDIERAMSASRCVFFADSAEMDPGSAFLHGLAVSQKIPASLFYSSSVLLTGPGGQSMRRNLMLAESAQHIFSNLNSLIEFLA
jgi:nucleoside 2-deoxyribosyltransferase